MGTRYGCIFHDVSYPQQTCRGGISGLSYPYHLYQIGKHDRFCGQRSVCSGMDYFGVEIRCPQRYRAILCLDAGLTASMPVVTSNLLLASVLGAGRLGAWACFSLAGLHRGTAIIAQLINHFAGLSSGKSLIGADLVIIVAAGFIFSP